MIQVMKTTFIDTKTKSGKNYKLHVKIWGEKNPRTLVCVHGLTGNSKDFKYVGERLSEREGYRVVAIDIAGRGESAYYDDPQDYSFDQYLTDLNALLSNTGCTAPASCDWLGVSMGGLLGMIICSQPNSPISKMIAVDIGPEVPQADLDFIGQYITYNGTYDSLEQVSALLKMALNSPYSRGNMTEDKWLHFAGVYYKKNAEGKYARNMDGNIAEVFKSKPFGHFDMWEHWKNTRQPVLSIRGGISTLFPEPTAQKMKETKTGAPMELVTIPDCGHVPSLYPDDQIGIIADWLRRTPVPEA